MSRLAGASRARCTPGSASDGGSSLECPDYPADSCRSGAEVDRPGNARALAAPARSGLPEAGVAVTESSGWVPEGVDITVPNASRVYDFALGGVHNFRVDRDFFTQAEQVMPQLRLLAQANRAFLGRAVRWLTAAGMRQFLDLASGI